MSFAEKGLIAGLFWLNVAFMLYSGCAPACEGPPGSIIGYAVTSFVVGWTAFLLALITTTVVPRMHGGKTVAALLPIIGVAIWGALILSRAMNNLPWPACSTSRVFVVGTMCSIQFLQTLMLGLTVFLRIVMPQSRSELERAAAAVAVVVDVDVDVDDMTTI